MKKVLFAVFVLLLYLPSRAEHLIGGDLGYVCLGGNRFEIKLSVYRDCLNSETPLDNPAYVTIFNNDTRTSTNVTLGLATVRNIPLNDLGPCVQTPPAVCIERGDYQLQISLTPNNLGYYIVYQRCCRNNSIQNLNLPGTQGSTYSILVPRAAFTNCNSTPVFSSTPPPALCVNENFVFDYSATDSDGDSLSYSLCAPFQGADQVDPAPVVATPPPYIPVLYNGGYDEFNPLGQPGTMSIDENTGLLTAIPPRQGQYVIGICVSEFRNGNLLSQYFRDFQFNVANCNVARAKVGFTELLNCKDSTITFLNQSSGNFTNYWEFFLPGDTLTSTDKSPVFTYPDTGTYIAKLVINRGQTCSDSTYATVKIYPEPTADFTASSACEMEGPVIFTNTSTSPLNNIDTYQWTLGNGSTSSAKDTQAVYPSDGSYPVSLAIMTVNGCVDTVIKTINVFPKPVADFSPDAACEDVPIQFNNTSQSAVPIASTAWSFSGASITSASDNAPTTSFDSQGLFNVQLIVTDENGCEDTISKDVQVFPPIAAAFTPDITLLCEGDAVTFSNQSVGIIDQYIWRYGDGTPNGGANDTVHTYLTAGDYTAQLVVVNNTCGSDTASKDISVKPAPIVDIGGRQLSICSGDTVTLSVGTTAYDSILWNTGERTPDILIDTPGVYSVAVFTNGCSSTDSVIVNTFCLVYVPTAFSPNGDGRNELFNVIDKNIATFSLTIYNRWYEPLYATSSVSGGWDGSFKGSLCPVDVYIYHVEGIKTDGVPFEEKGIFNLLR